MVYEAVYSCPEQLCGSSRQEAKQTTVDKDMHCTTPALSNGKSTYDNACTIV